MTLLSREYGEDTGAPINLLRFESDALDAPILWTDIAFPVTHGGQVYQPVPVRVGNISTGDALDKAQLELEVPTDSEVPMLFRYYPLGGVLHLTILYGHDGDPANEFAAIWSGRVLQVSHKDDQGTATLDCEPISTALRRPGLRRNYQRMCQHALYGPKCRVQKAAHTISATIVNADNGKVQIDEPPSFSLFRGGSIEWVRKIPGQIPVRDTRMITDVMLRNGKMEITTLSPVIGAIVGEQVSLSRGCDHALATCSGVFNNAPNYGGMPWIPLDNPAGGKNIY